MTENTMHEHDLVRSTELTGHGVKNPMGDVLGSIEDVVIDLSTGRIAFAVLSFDRRFGMGDKFYAIPWRALNFSPEKKEFVFDVDKEKLENAPGFNRNRWPEMADRTWGAEIAKYYGHRPYWEVVMG